MYARSRVSSVSFFSLLPPARNKRGGEGLLYMCVELVGEKLPPHSMCGSLIFDR